MSGDVPKGIPVIHSESIVVETRGRGLLDITERIATCVARTEVDVGLASLFLRHTSASLLITENADPAVLRDLERWLDALAPEHRGYEHDDEGPDDMPAHLKAAITRTQEQIPIRGGAMLLGTWQGIYVWEHRRVPHRREIVVTILG